MTYTAKKTDVFENMTNAVIAELEKGNLFWKKTWNSLGGPKNFVSKRSYTGFNSLWLAFIANEKEYKTPFWLTFKQVNDLGGRICKGQKATLIYYMLNFKVAKGKNEEAEATEDESGFKNILIPKPYLLFNLDQTEGITIPELEAVTRSETEVIEACEQAIAQYKNAPVILHKGFEAFYVPSTDTIQLPEPQYFHNDALYYRTKFHELAHSTGHVTRLSRIGITDVNRNNKERYSEEELVAEFTTTFLCNHCGIINETFESNTAYIQGWLEPLKNDKKFLFRAASQAQKAFNYMLNIIPEEVKEAV